MLGRSINEISDATIIQIDPKHKPDEGKLKGAWELFEDDGIVDLRVDLQPQKLSGRDDHYGDRDFANFQVLILVSMDEWYQVQFGPSDVCKRSSRKTDKAQLSGGFAGAFVATDVPHKLGHLREALEMSFECGSYVILHRPSTSVHESELSDVAKLQVFCDLDGVLAGERPTS